MKLCSKFSDKNKKDAFGNRICAIIFKNISFGQTLKETSHLNKFLTQTSAVFFE